MARDSEVIQRQHFCHHGDTICHPKSGYVTTKLHGTSNVDATIMRSFQAELFSRFLPSSYAGHVNLTASTKHWQFMPKCKHGSTVELTHFIPTTTVVVVTLSIPTTTVVVGHFIPTTKTVVDDNDLSNLSAVNLHNITYFKSSNLPIFSLYLE